MGFEGLGQAVGLGQEVLSHVMSHRNNPICSVLSGKTLCNWLCDNTV